MRYYYNSSSCYLICYQAFFLRHFSAFKKFTITNLINAVFLVHTFQTLIFISTIFCNIMTSFSFVNRTRLFIFYFLIIIESIRNTLAALIYLVCFVLWHVSPQRKSIKRVEGRKRSDKL